MMITIRKFPNQKQCRFLQLVKANQISLSYFWTRPYAFQQHNLPQRGAINENVVRKDTFLKIQREEGSSAASKSQSLEKGKQIQQ